MPIVLKLKHYQVDEVKGPWLLKGVVSLSFAVVVAAVVYSFVSEGGPAAAPPCHASGSLTGSAVVGVQPFKSANWRHLEKGQAAVRCDRVDTDLRCPGWEERAELKGLKALAVYEAKGGEGSCADVEETRKMAEMMQGVNPR